MTEVVRIAGSRLCTPPPGISEEDRARLAALRRALSLPRLIGNGMDFADATALHAMTEAGVPWTVAAEAIGEAALQRARAAADGAQIVTSRDLYRQASACFRFGQSALDADDDEKRRLHSRALACFAQAARLDDPPTAPLSVPWKDGRLAAWLMMPAGVVRPPAVVIFGGADGWKEEYHPGARGLVERGIAAVLLDGPGQGETRLCHGVPMTEPPDQALSAVLGALLDHPALGERIGIWGNSLGGTFAARAASSDARFAACCVNSGSAVPIAGFRRHKRLLEKRFAMVGRRDAALADAVFEALTLPAADNRIACPLLVLHGAADVLFTVAETRPLYADAPSAEKTLIVWDDGDHCIYNHSHEKHSTIADWFVRHLGGSPTDATSPDTASASAAPRPSPRR